MQTISVRRSRVEDIKPYPQTARRHSSRKLAKLRASVSKFGIITPILVDENSTIVDGHARFIAAKDLGHREVPTISTLGLLAEDIRALRLALNRLQGETTWDRAVVQSELKALIDLDYDLDLTAFDSVEIDSFVEINPVPAGEIEELDASSLEDAAVPIARVGDVWLLGKHRVGCGDCLDQLFRRSVLNHKLADVCFTDPPYNVKINGNVSGLNVHEEFAMASGEMSEAEFGGFLRQSADAVKDSLSDTAISFVCMDWRGLSTLIKAADAIGFETVNIAVWVKTNPGMGSLYRSQHEFITVLKAKGARHRNNVELGKHGRSRSNVWTYRGVNVMGPERPLLREHPTVKPAALVADALRDVSKAGDRVFDPFLGSGSTLIAAERTKRVCIGIEISPRFVDTHHTPLAAGNRWRGHQGGRRHRLRRRQIFGSGLLAPSPVPHH
ncbi:site-specific DNA-methyltransferase [Mesorhizobium escarrei]|uniref:Methyltransferase n=1 Tax=Mesorhizobium escarrei TaxID=666018 RepID=A0ABN8JG55_9HYPH|nr:site-specific DNA-methyltransferase [Mesorhizobium escarrei]CAH2396490.1 Methyltransferase [Mesorhizobium escarrei]